MKNLTPTETVKQIGRLNLSGNVIPANWWHHIKTPSGRPDSTAIILLSEIIYWYRPTEVRDESTGELKGWSKRFQGEKLQRSYQSFAEQFGFTKREVTDALKRLKSQGIITLELRTINTSTGACSNVLFIEPVPARIDEITNSRQLVDNQLVSESVHVTPPTLKRKTPYVEMEHLLRSNVTPPTLKRKTYTETTTENTNIDPSIISLTKKSKVFEPSSVELPDWLSISTWHSWLQYRKEINKPIKSQMTVNQTIKLLAKCRDSGYSPEDIINTSIANGWQGLFEPKPFIKHRAKSLINEITTSPSNPEGFVVING